MAEENDGMLFDPSMKKKKKKKTPINLDELDDAPEPVSQSGGGGNVGAVEDEVSREEENEVQVKMEKVVDDLDLDDFSTFKKKKKKKKGAPVLDMDSVADALPEVDVPTDEINTEKQVVEPTEDESREYTYEELLARVFVIMHEKNPNMEQGGKRKFVMKPPQVVRVGTKRTSFVNFTEICKILHRQPKHLLMFLLAELGTSGTVDGTNQLIIKGKFQQKHIENVLKRYIKEYVTCHTCRSPETILHKETRLFFLQCETCGSKCSVASIKSGFQAVTTKRARMKDK